MSKQIWARRSLIVNILLLTLGAEGIVHAASPFKDGDFVSVPGLAGIEVQKHELTYAQWNMLNDQLPIDNQIPWESKECKFIDPSFDHSLEDYIGKGFGPNYPAACISFYDAETYIRVLNSQDLNYTYRLPTQDEFEVLLKKSRDDSASEGYHAVKEHSKKHSWYYSNSGGSAHEVCTKDLASGLCDILGNLREWSSTESSSYYDSGGYNHRFMVVYGDSWVDDISLSTRDLPPAESRRAWLGFRLVRAAK